MWLPGTLPSLPGLRTVTGVISHQKKVPINVFTTVIHFHTGLMCFDMQQDDGGVVLNIKEEDGDESDTHSECPRSWRC